MLSYDLTEKEFRRFQALVYEKCGIHLHDGKRELVRARLAKRLRQKKIKGFGTYYRYLTEEDNGEELIQMLDAISTNLTSFFREIKHFEFMEKEVLPELKVQMAAGRIQKLQIWSAGCSSGEEPYSLGISLLEQLGAEWAKRIEIFASDISSRVLAVASDGIYAGSRLNNVSNPLMHKYFQKGEGKWDGYVRIKPLVRDRIVFQRLNLMDAFPFKERFHLIFCRNVMIYFDKQKQENLVNKFYNCLSTKGYLFIGHSESLMNVNHPFHYIRPTIYRKI